MTDLVDYQLLPCAQSSHCLGLITLRAEKKLNALNREMVVSLHQKLTAWAADDRIVCVFLQGAGDKSFCAGGDVKGLCQNILQHGAEQALPDVQGFFENEYRLDYLLHRYPKPIVGWGQGIVMGGGLGLLVGVSHGVVTQTVRLAMPEITIGLYPDVGGTWFLNRAPGRSGLFLGLTGASFGPEDAVFLGLVDRVLDSGAKADVINDLQQANWGCPQGLHAEVVSGVLRNYQQTCSGAESNVYKHFDVIQKLTDGVDLVDIATNITNYDGNDVWLQEAAQKLRNGCSVTAHLVYRQWLDGKKLSLREVFARELVMSLQCALHPDFPEGVRALLIDKDRQPNWRFASVADVPAEWIDAHFEPPWKNANNPLDNLSG